MIMRYYVPKDCESGVVTYTECAVPLCDSLEEYAEYAAYDYFKTHIYDYLTLDGAMIMSTQFADMDHESRLLAAEAAHLIVRIAIVDDAGHETLFMIERLSGFGQTPLYFAYQLGTDASWC